MQKFRLFHGFILKIWLIKKSCNLIGSEHFDPYFEHFYPKYEIRLCHAQLHMGLYKEV